MLFSIIIAIIALFCFVLVSTTIMGKPGSVRQKEYGDRKRSCDKEDFLMEQQVKKRRQREKLKADTKKYEAAKSKDRAHKRKPESNVMDKSFQSR